MSITAAAEIRLVNNIAVQFGYLPTEEAAAAVANHINRFWDPRMKRRLFELAVTDKQELDPVAAAAVALL